MRRLHVLPLALATLALAACDASAPVRPPPDADGPRLATVAADACAVDGELTVRRIDPPGAERSRAIAVNDLGEVVVVDDETGAAFLWSAASGFQPIPIESPRAVNNQSQVVGTNGQYGESVPLLWSPSGGLQSLALPAGYAHAVAYDINNAGVIVGGAVAYPAALPLRWVGGVPDPLFLPEDLYGPPSPANAVNDRGDVVGTVWPESYVYSLIWPNDGDVPVQAGGLVHDINDARQFVSTQYDEVSADASASLCQLYGDCVQIAPASGVATTAVALNDAAVVVGERYPVDIYPTAPRRAYRWTSAGGVDFLPLLPGTDSSSGVDINEAGVIVGRSNSIAVLWAPTTTPAAALTALADQVRALATSGGIAQTDAAPLLAKLTNAGRLLAAERLAAARGLIDAFANLVRALERAGRIDAATAGSLLGAASCLTRSL